MPADAAIEIHVTGTDSTTRRLLSAAARAALNAKRRHRARIEIAVINDAEMRRQHRQWLGKASTTDVLTFDLRKSGRGPIDGQILVCESVARRCAKLHEETAARSESTARRPVTHTRRQVLAAWQRELVLYVVHGCLHLCGHDDRRPEDFARMHALEDRILSRMGLGPVFATTPSSRR